MSLSNKSKNQHDVTLEKKQSRLYEYQFFGFAQEWECMSVQKDEVKGVLDDAKKVLLKKCNLTEHCDKHFGFIREDF